MKPLLIVITGPTGSGKTELAIKIAQRVGCDIISADSRQIYRDLNIGTASPTPAQLSTVKHYFVANLDLMQYYSAACFEQEVIDLLPLLFSVRPYAIMCGGSMMYVDAVVNGIDQLPTISDETRADVMRLYNDHGIDAILDELKYCDPVYLESVDINNHRRLLHAVEICRESGMPYSKLRTGQSKERPFDTVKFMIDYPRADLFDRINRRVDAMIERGLEDEARSVYHLRHLNSLNTVGYKEMFAYFDGVMDRGTAIERIKKNTRVYAKKQLTWLAKDAERIYRLAPDNAEEQAMQILTLHNITQ